jgi:hypothetical protein
MVALEQFHSFPEPGTSSELPVTGWRDMMLLKIRSRRVGTEESAAKREGCKEVSALRSIGGMGAETVAAAGGRLS